MTLQERIATAFTRTPAFAKFEAEQIAADGDARKAVHHDGTKALAVLERKQAQAADAVAAAQAAVDGGAGALAVAKRALLTALTESHSFSTKAEQVRTAMERALIESAPPELPAFMRCCRNEQDAIRAGSAVSVPTGGGHKATAVRARVIARLDATQDALAALDDAVSQAEALLLLPEDPATIVQKLAVLRASTEKAVGKRLGPNAE